MFVPKVPRRYDFCGRPPCGLCFDWVEPCPPLVVQEDTPICEPVEIRVDGLVKMTEDLTAKPYAEVSETQRKEVKRIAEDMHNRALVSTLEGPPPDDPGTTFQEAEDTEWFWKDVTQKRIAAERERAYQAELNKPKSLDQMDWGASDEAKELVDEKKQEKKKKKELEQAAQKEREKEASRLAREQREAYDRMLRDSYKLRY